MADWGLYSALRGTDDWQSKRADALMNLQAAEKRQQLALQQEQEAMKMEEYMNQYTSAMQELDVLAGDQERVQGVEKDARQAIVDGIAKYDGDIRKFMASGGITKLNQYKSNVVNSEEYKGAIQNKQNEALWLQDRAKGNRYIKKTEVEVPSVDENGNTVMKKQMLSMEEQKALFDAGKIKSLNYAGSENKVNVDAMHFKNSFKDHMDPYGPNYVSASEIYERAITLNASDEQAYDIANRYQEMIANGGEVWKWGAKDPYALKATYDKMNMTANMANQRAGMTAYQQMQMNRRSQAKASQGQKQANRRINSWTTKMQQLKNGGEGTAMGLLPTERDYILGLYNVISKGDKEPTYNDIGKKISGGDFKLIAAEMNGNLTGDPRNVNIENADILDWGTGPKSIVNHNGKNYMQVVLAVPKANVESWNLNKDPDSIWRNVANKEIESVTGDGDDKIRTVAYVDLDEAMTTERVWQMSSKNPKQGEVQMEARGTDYGDLQESNMEMVKNLAEDYILEQEEEGKQVSYEEALIYAEKILQESTDTNWGQYEYSTNEIL